MSFIRRGWLAFSLRTLLVAVTCLCVWLGWEMSIVRERLAVIALAQEQLGYIDSADNKTQSPLANAAPRISTARRLLGDRDVVAISFPEAPSSELQHQIEEVLPGVEVKWASRRDVVRERKSRREFEKSGLDCSFYDPDVRGEKDGAFSHTWNDGSRVEGFIKDGHWHGYCRYLRADGALKEEGEYIDGLREGAWLNWAEDGIHLSAVVPVRAGIREGTITYFHPNGRRREQGELRDEKPVGTWITWDDAGNELSRQNFPWK